MIISLRTGLTALFLVSAALGAGSAANAQQTKATPAPKMNKMRKMTAPAAQKATVKVTDKGYEPSRLNLKAGVPAQVTFLRTSDQTCGTEVLLPDYKIQKDLPLNKPVMISFTPKKAGTFAFTCGMKMIKGSVVVK